MKFIAAFFAVAALAVAAPTAASAQIMPGAVGVTAGEPNGIIAILIGFTPPIGQPWRSGLARTGRSAGSRSGEAPTG